MILLCAKESRFRSRRIQDIQDNACMHTSACMHASHTQFVSPSRFSVYSNTPPWLTFNEVEPTLVADGQPGVCRGVPSHAGDVSLRASHREMASDLAAHERLHDRCYARRDWSYLTCR